MAAMKPDPSINCWLCERSLGRVVQWHHPVPKAKGGRETVPLHPICHRVIHAKFTNAELFRAGGARAALTAHPEIARFLAWIAGKPPDFHAPTRLRNNARR
ncbi:MAG: HNH endonuclease [Sphingomonadales bacterium 32-68-7]|nr:MAG: HNH endonuclease [Sphingomonadales bacterium 12-68-11]OYX07593.1 MAG: HNH endonuclease [Sphingomonadales bacterium 32-68-7]